MQRHTESVRLATAKMREDFCEMNDGREYYLCIITFNQLTELSQPLTHSSAPYTDNYRAMGGTALYSAVYETMGVILSGLEEDPKSKVSPDLQISVCVFSDGDDRDSKQGDLTQVQRLSREVQDSDVNWQLQTIGIGIDGSRLAETMGFPPELAITVEASARGVEEAMSCSTSMTTMTPHYARELRQIPDVESGVDNTMDIDAVKDDEDPPSASDSINTLMSD
jgi:hypothetical protein